MVTVEEKPNAHNFQLIRDLSSENTRGHYELDVASSYTAALSKAQRRNYDICFAPSRIGEHDVVDLLSEMSKNELKTPVVIITESMESRIDDADTNRPKEAYSFTKDHLSGNFLEQHIRYAMENKRVESAVMRAKKELELIFDTVPDPIAIIDQNHLIKRVNRAMADCLKSKPADLLGRSCYEVVHGLPSPPDFCPLSLMLKDGQEHFAEIFEKNMDGYYSVSASPLYDEAGHLIAGVHAARNINARKKVEEEIHQLNQMFDTTMGENKEKRVYFLNCKHILWVQPDELQTHLPDGISLESDLE